MKQVVSFSLILSLALPLIVPINKAFAEVGNISSESETLLLSSGRGGGNRGGGNRGGGRSSVTRSGTRNINRSSAGAKGSGRVNRSSASNPNRSGSNRSTVNSDRKINRASAGANGSGRIDRDKVRDPNINRDNVRDPNINRDNVRNNDIDRNNVRNRIDNSREDFSMDNDRRYSNRINRNIINTGDRNIIINPRVNTWGGAWGWNNGVIWRPNYGYWGGGFWGGFAVGAVTVGVTSAIINAANDEPEYIIIQQGTPGYTLFDSYGLIQVRCIENESLVYVYGPQDSLICATPNDFVTAGYYDVDPETLTLIARY